MFIFNSIFLIISLFHWVVGNRDEYFFWMRKIKCKLPFLFFFLLSISEFKILCNKLYRKHTALFPFLYTYSLYIFIYIFFFLLFLWSWNMYFILKCRYVLLKLFFAFECQYLHRLILLYWFILLAKHQWNLIVGFF